MYSYVKYVIIRKKIGCRFSTKIFNFGLAQKKCSCRKTIHTDARTDVWFCYEKYVLKPNLTALSLTYRDVSKVLFIVLNNTCKFKGGRSGRKLIKYFKNDNIGGGNTAFKCKWNNRVGKICECKWCSAARYSKTRKNVIR